MQLTNMWVGQSIEFYIMFYIMIMLIFRNSCGWNQFHKKESQIEIRDAYKVEMQAE